jgi:hypothetical protein
MYPITEDDARLRMLENRPVADRAAYFTSLRKTYPHRRAFSRHTLPGEAVPPAYRTAVEQGLRVTLRDTAPER